MVKGPSRRSDTAELEELMREFPDWKKDFPELNLSVYPERHYKARKINAVGQERVIQKKRASTVPVSGYHDEYPAHARPRPRSTKKPPPTPRDPRPPPMTFTTNQRSDYTPKDLSVRPEPVMKEDNYVRPEGQMVTRSQYRLDFKGEFQLPELRAGPPRPDMTRQPGTFDGRTTTKEHYQAWVPQPALTFSELPCFTGSILYPDDRGLPQSTTQDTFKGKFVPRPDQIQRTEGNISIEGHLRHNTTHRDTYKDTAGARPAQRVSQRTTVIVAKRGKVSSESQSRKDFPGYASGQPAPPRPCTPPPATIDLKFDNRYSFDTEQRASYPGVDAVKHPPPVPIRKEDNTYHPPDVKFEAESHVKRDFPPIDVRTVYRPPAKQQQPARHAGPKFHSVTTHSHFFKHHPVAPRVIHGDIHEGHPYVPPQDKFTAVSTTHDTYKGEMAPVPAACKPIDRPVERTGELDFSTVHRSAYSCPTLANQLPQFQRKLMLDHLRQRKQEQMDGRLQAPGHAVASY